MSQTLGHRSWNACGAPGPHRIGVPGRGRLGGAQRGIAGTGAVGLHGLLAYGMLRHMDVEDRVPYPALARAGRMSVDLLAMDHRAIAGLEREVALAEDALSQGGLEPENRRKLVRTRCTAWRCWSTWT